jgi:hypothetical protein
VDDFLRVVEYKFKLCMHLYNSPKMNTIEDCMHATKVKINEKKEVIPSLPSVERQETMMKIVELHREIAFSRFDQHKLLAIMLDAMEKAQQHYYKLTDVETREAIVVLLGA